ncbi:DNA-binding transcriptional LysR family regulator [Comamonas sp. BIGb0124]|nr:DNA-binding transcriptional LysR family regulator [Comamonas sp. BIGb0124]
MAGGIAGRNNRRMPSRPRVPPFRAQHLTPPFVPPVPPAAKNAETDGWPGNVHFDLVTVRLFIETAETGNITRAAERLPLAVAAASRRLKELEQQFGVPLFQRMPHGMALTAAGSALLAHARTVAHAVSRMRDDAQAFRHGTQGVVRIAACTSAVLQFLPQDLQQCHSRYPGIKIDLQELNSQGVLQSLARGLADIGIFESTAGTLPLPTRPYHHDRLALVVHRHDALASLRDVALDDFIQRDLIGLTEGSAISTTLYRLAAQARRTLRMRIRVGSFDSMVAMIAQGVGIGVMPHAVAQSFMPGHAVHALAITGEWPQRHFLLGHQIGTALATAATAVISLLTPGCTQTTNPD